MSGLEFLDGMKQRVDDIGAACRRILAGPAVIESGPAKGLRFDAGADNARFEKGDYEYPVQQALASLLHPGDVCYDIGANLGFFTVLLARLVSAEGMVYGFEPVPANVLAIKRNARLNGLRNIRVLQLALTSGDGESELLLARHVGGAVLRDAGTPPDPAGSLMVRTAAIDSLVARGELAPPRLVKIDVEGAEMAVLIGMEHTLRENAPIVILELDGATQAECERKVSECRSFLQGLGYCTEPLHNSYPDGKWYVRHFCAVRSHEGYRT